MVPNVLLLPSLLVSTLFIVALIVEIPKILFTFNLSVPLQILLPSILEFQVLLWYTLIGAEQRELSVIKAMVAKVNVPEFVPRKVKIVVDEEQKKAENETPALEDEGKKSSTFVCIN